MNWGTTTEIEYLGIFLSFSSVRLGKAFILKTSERSGFNSNFKSLLLQINCT